jgi:hypothetical protein
MPPLQPRASRATAPPRAAAHFGLRLVDAIGLHGEVRQDRHALGSDLDQPLTGRDEQLASILRSMISPGAISVINGHQKFSKRLE